MNVQYNDIVVTEQMVTNDVAIVRVRLYLESQERTYEATGVAKRDPVDRPNPRLAHLLAYGRAVQILSAKMLNDAKGQVKHQDDLREMRPVQVERNKKWHAAQKRKRTAKGNKKTTLQTALTR